MCTADGRPAIYCEDVVEKALAKGITPSRTSSSPSSTSSSGSAASIPIWI
ncbi:MAG: hypothetical protein ACLTYN_14060 [Dysosmobacter welbionis]